MSRPASRRPCGPASPTPARRATATLAALATLAVALGCKRADPIEPPAPPPPTERLTLVAKDAPLLNELEDDEAAAQVARRGDLVWRMRDRPAMASPWKAKLDGVAAERTGPVSEVQLAKGDAILYAFQADLGEPVEVPAASWICERLARTPGPLAAEGGPICAGLLHRARLDDGTIVAHAPCAAGPCVVALVRKNLVRAITVDGMTAAQIVPTEVGPVLLATCRWARADGTWTGGTLVPVSLGEDGPRALEAIPLDEVDARDPVVITSRMIQFAITSPAPGRTAIHITGDRRQTRRADGQEQARSPIDEVRPVLGR